MQREIESLQQRLLSSGKALEREKRKAANADEKMRYVVSLLKGIKDKQDERHSDPVPRRAKGKGKPKHTDGSHSTISETHLRSNERSSKKRTLKRMHTEEGRAVTVAPSESFHDTSDEEKDALEGRAIDIQSTQDSTTARDSQTSGDETSPRSTEDEGSTVSAPSIDVVPVPSKGVDVRAEDNNQDDQAERSDTIVSTESSVDTRDTEEEDIVKMLRDPSETDDESVGAVKSRSANDAEGSDEKTAVAASRRSSSASDLSLFQLLVSPTRQGRDSSIPVQVSRSLSLTSLSK